MNIWRWLIILSLSAISFFLTWDAKIHLQFDWLGNSLPNIIETLSGTWYWLAASIAGWLITISLFLHFKKQWRVARLYAMVEGLLCTSIGLFWGVRGIMFIFHDLILTHAPLQEPGLGYIAGLVALVCIALPTLSLGIFLLKYRPDPGRFTKRIKGSS